jgi:ribosome maturation factor RimP
VELGQSIAKRVEDAISPLLAHDGYDVVLVEYVPRAKVLRLFIDRDGGVTLDDCTRVSHRVGDLLDAEGLTEGTGGIDGQYTLEVSSPGLDRPLVRPAHFQRFVGHEVQVATREPVAAAGRRKLTGKLVAADERSICVESEGQPYTLAYDAIERARLVPQL